MPTKWDKNIAIVKTEIISSGVLQYENYDLDSL